MGPGSDQARRAPDGAMPSGGAGAIGRRTFLGGAALLLLWPGRAVAQPAIKPERGKLPPRTIQALQTSPFVYISPLKSNGEESTCHGEVWFAWLDGAVLVNSRRGTWKVKALERGMQRARIWVGDFGRWKTGVLGTERNEAFRSAPSFVAHARFETDRAVLDRLIAADADKYGKDFDRWREDMRTGFFSGQRKLIRYEPI
jgi:hypothetical protein